MFRRIALAAVIALGLAAGGGCSRAISEGMEKTLGPTGIVSPMDPRWPEKDQMYLASYRNFELEQPIKSQFPDTPAEFMHYFPIKLNEQLAGKSLPTDRNGKTLLIDVDILGYQSVSSYQKAWGPTEEVVARVTLKDKASGKIVGRAICFGRTYQSVGLGPKWKAWGLARAIVNGWIDKYYPKEGRKEYEEQSPPGGE